MRPRFGERGRIDDSSSRRTRDLSPRAPTVASSISAAAQCGTQAWRFAIVTTHRRASSCAQGRHPARGRLSDTVFCINITTHTSSTTSNSECAAPHRLSRRAVSCRVEPCAARWQDDVERWAAGAADRRRDPRRRCISSAPSCVHTPRQARGWLTNAVMPGREHRAGSRYRWRISSA